MLKKQIAKEREKDAARSMRAGKTGQQKNQNEFIERSRQNYDLSSSMISDADFDNMGDEEEMNPKYIEAYQKLRKKQMHFLTMDDDLLTDEDDCDSDDELSRLHEMLHKSQSETKTLFVGDNSKLSQFSQSELESQINESFGGAAEPSQTQDLTSRMDNS